MAKLTVLRGYSGSGKSTYAAQQTDAVIVSRDHIRQMFTHNTTKTTVGKDEDVVTAIELAQIEALLDADKWVIVDNTNLKPAFARKYLNLAADLGVEWEVKDFTTPLETCLSNNLWRVPMNVDGPDFSQGGVPPHVIEQQAKRHPMPWPVLEPGASHFKAVFEPYRGADGPNAYAFDIDGTLAHANHRNVYDFTKYATDDVDLRVANLLTTIRYAYDESIVIFSGRDETYREVTEQWLDFHDIYCSALYMRPAGDKRRDDVVKSELLDACPYNIIGVFDDRDRVVTMWRERGIKTYQVERGDF